jgi:hypothetical protein
MPFILIVIGIGQSLWAFQMITSKSLIAACSSFIMLFKKNLQITFHRRTFAPEKNT